MFNQNQITESISWTIAALLLIVESTVLCGHRVFLDSLRNITAFHSLYIHTAMDRNHRVQLILNIRFFFVRHYKKCLLLDNIKVIQQKAGYDIKLQCDLKGLIGHDTLTSTKIHWFFKQCCGYSCEAFQQDDWIHLPCKEIFCQHDLLLRNVTEQYSGLYRCTIHPYRLDDSTTLDIQLARIYQLVVKNDSVQGPEFFDTFQSNETVKAGLQVSLECRVHSMIQAAIKWFRRFSEINADTEHTLGSDNFSSRLFRYNGHIYKMLDAGCENVTNNNIYLSEFVLSSVQPQDEGFYACVAINYHGYSVKETFLRVYEQSEVEYWTDYDVELNGTDPKQFWLFFLMPLCLATLPLSVWLCYTISKKFSTDSIESTNNGQVYFSPHH